MMTDKGIINAGLTGGAVASFKKNGFDVVIFDQVIPDAPVSIVMKATDLARKEKVDIVLGIGGGSTLDSAKVVSVMVPYEGPIHDYLGDNQVKKRGLPKILVSTTAGTGSELSNTFVLVDDLITKLS